jgi:hypothetical protein
MTKASFLSLGNPEGCALRVVVVKYVVNDDNPSEGGPTEAVGVEAAAYE